MSGLLAFFLIWIADFGHISAQESATNDAGPTLESVSLNVDTITDGGTIEVTIRVRSEIPITWINRSLDGPSGQSIYGGGHGATFVEISQDLWQYRWSDTISRWQPSGTYVYEDISVEDAGGSKSPSWPDVFFTVDNTVRANEPIIESVIVDPNVVVNGGSVDVTVRARSNAPVNWINRSLYGPYEESIYGGGHGTSFNRVSDDIWEYQWSDEISEWQPSGEYVYRRISVENAGDLTSAIWPDVKFTVMNSLQAESPAIESVEVLPSQLVEGGTVEVTVSARSNAPVNWINSSLYGPDGENLYGGGHGATFVEVEEGLWQYRWTYTISEWRPVGEYEFRHISVTNEGRLTSGIWPNVSFSVTDLPVNNEMIRTYFPFIGNNVSKLLQ